MRTELNEHSVQTCPTCLPWLWRYNMPIIKRIQAPLSKRLKL